MRKMLSKALVLLLVVALVIPFQMLATTDANFYYDESEELYEEILFIEDFFDCPEFTDNISNQFIYEFGEEFMNNLDTATAMADQIWESFPTNRAGHRMYPDAFGGTYIDAYGNLVLLIVSDVANIDSASIDVINNRVNVYLIDVAECNVELFELLVMEHPSLVFIESLNLDVGGYVAYECFENVYISEHNYERSVSQTVRPGNAITRSNGARRSIGFRASFGGFNGFVTAAHGDPPVQPSERFYFRNEYIGWVMRTNWTTDTAFVALESRHSIVNTNIADTAFTVSGASIMASPQTGQPVRRFSQGGTGSPVHDAGTIMHISHIHNGDLGPVQTIRATYSRSSGDSGGIIVSHDLRVAGTHVGVNSATGHATFSHVSRTMVHLGVTPF